MFVVVVVLVSVVAFAILMGLLALSEHVINVWTIHTETQEMNDLLVEMKLKALKRQMYNLPVPPEGGQSYREPLPDNVVRFKAHPVELALALGLLNPEDPDEGHSQR